MHSKHPRNKGIVVCFEGKSVYPFACMLHKTNKCPEIKKTQTQNLYMLNSVQNQQHTLCELKNIYFEFQSRIPWARGLDVARGRGECSPAHRSKETEEVHKHPGIFNS